MTQTADVLSVIRMIYSVDRFIQQYLTTATRAFRPRASSVSEMKMMQRFSSIGFAWSA